MPLTPDEDADLRRLHGFARIGFLDRYGEARLTELRGRDRRTSVREVAEAVESLAPVTRSGALARGRHCSLYPR